MKDEGLGSESRPILTGYIHGWQTQLHRPIRINTESKKNSTNTCFTFLFQAFHDPKTPKTPVTKIMTRCPETPRAEQPEKKGQKAGAQMCTPSTGTANLSNVGIENASIKHEPMPHKTSKNQCAIMTLSRASLRSLVAAPVADARSLGRANGSAPKKKKKERKKRVETEKEAPAPRLVRACQHEEEAGPGGYSQNGPTWPVWPSGCSIGSWPSSMTVSL